MGMRHYGTPVTGYGIASISNSVTVYDVASTESFHLCKMNVGIPVGVANSIWRVCGGTGAAASGFWGGGGSAPATYLGDWGDEGLSLGAGNDLMFTQTGASATMWYSYVGYVR
ncbi:MAG: hypothetical protein ACXABY_23965 [Candidatus Thorarchaeota archaeon]|jgi:hypothetical protein